MLRELLERRYKAFRIRVGEYRVTYVVFYDRNLLLVADIDKRQRAYD